MRRGAAAAAALLAGTLTIACQPGTPPPPPVPTGGEPLFIAGYHPWWAGESWRSYPLESLDRVYLFELEISADGGVGNARGWPTAWREQNERSVCCSASWSSFSRKSNRPSLPPPGTGTRPSWPNSPACSNDGSPE